MAESKRTFHAGKMNRDLDDRIVPNGEYRDAVNVNIGRSEGSSVGALENLKGNERIHNNLNVDFTAMEGQMFFALPDNATGVFEVVVDGEVLPTGMWSFGPAGVTFEEGVAADTMVNITYDVQPDGLTIGTVVDPNNDRFYWFTAFQDINAIYEYDVNTGRTTTILTDRERRTANLPTCAPNVDATITGTNDALGIRPDFPDFPTFPTGGCLDASASNYEASADYHDQSVCRYDVVGCGDPTALNYNPAVTVDDRNLCQYPLNNFTFEDSTLTCSVDVAGNAVITWILPGLMWSVNVEGETASQADDTDGDMSVTIDIGASVGMDRPVLFQFTITVPDGFDNGPTITGGEAECYSLQEGSTPAPPGEFTLQIVPGTAVPNGRQVGSGVAVGAMGNAVTTDFTFTLHENTGFGFTEVPRLRYIAQSGDGTITASTNPAATGSYQASVTEVTIGTEDTILAATWDFPLGGGISALYSPGDLNIACAITREGVITVTEADSVSITWTVQQLDSDNNRTGSVITGSPTSVPANTGVNAIRWIVDVTATVPAGHPNSPGAPGVTAGLYGTTVETSCSTDQLGSQPPTYTTTITTLDPGPNTEFVGTYTSEPAETGTALTTSTLFEVTPSVGYRFNRPGEVVPRIVNTTSGQAPEDTSRVTFTVNDGGDSPDTATVSGVTIGSENETYEVRWEAADEVTFDQVTVTLTLEQPNNAVANWVSAPSQASITFSGAPGDMMDISEMVNVVINEGFIDQNPSFLGPATVLLADGAMIPSLFPAPTGPAVLQQGFSLGGTTLAQITFPAENQEIIISVQNTYVARTAGRVYRISSDGVNFGVRADGSVIAANTMLLYDPPVDPVNNPFAGAFSGFGAMGDAGSFALLALDRNAVVYEVCSTTRPRFQNLAGGFDPNVNRAQSSFTITGPFETCYSDSLSGGSFHRASGGPGS